MVFIEKDYNVTSVMCLDNDVKSTCCGAVLTIVSYIVGFVLFLHLLFKM